MHTEVSTYGKFTPQIIIDTALEIQLRYILATDHYSTSSVKETIEIGNRYSWYRIRLHHNGVNINNETLLDYEQTFIKQDQDNSLKLIEAIEMINNAGGIPIFAHSGNNIRRNRELANGKTKPAIDMGMVEVPNEKEHIERFLNALYK